MAVLKELELFENRLILLNAVPITTSQSLSTKSDCRLLVDTNGVTVTLNYGDNEDGVKVEVFAFAPCTVKYYTNSTSSSTLSMVTNTSLQLIYHNGWKNVGMYNAVWN